MHLRIAAVSILSLSLLAACGGGGTPGTQTDFGRLSALKPGQQDTLRTTLKVNVVLVGYRQTRPGSVPGARDVNTADFSEILPGTYDTIARAPSAYGTTERTGNAFDYAYNYVFADQSFENDFFNFLAQNGKKQSLTIASALYNCQSDEIVAVPVLDPTTLRQGQGYRCPTPAANISREITSNLEIDGNVTENWLADNAGRLGVNPGEYTIFLVNWYDRPDFQFHSYTRADAIDTDIGPVAEVGKFGKRGSRRLIAWGGSVRENAPAQRVWFYDLSANPDYWTDAYDVTNPDVNGDKVADYRMPPIWEYGTRKASLGYARKVGPDLARVTRYIALNLLFTPSPLYRVALTPPRQPEEIELDVHIEQGAGAANPTDVFNVPLTQTRVSVLQPFAQFSNTVRQRPLSGEIAEAYKCVFVLEEKDLCTPEYQDPFFERLFQFGVNELRSEYQSVPQGRYLLPIYAFNAAEDEESGLLGIAIDDNQTGTQSFVYSFLSPGSINAGFGLTDTTVHEVGHHLSLSHPHDGYDSEEDTSYGPSGPFRFVDTGDESQTVMTYNSLAVTFGQFNLDSQYRYLTSAYLNNTNAILELARRAGKVNEVRGAAQSADAGFVKAKARYDAMSYFEAAQLAHSSYRSVLNAALSAGVDVQPYRWYQNLNGLSAQGKKPRTSKTFLPQPGAVLFPEETKEQRLKRLAP
ncbi:hypothetical protein DAETH_11010 [Deinococcus aetherius]|uniref:Peptidase M43 pregnancy-associated plasma-A domain-containing protein n=1 Tax=Deinococcus aetherius TaxID=200252 RepID=A0ABM8AC21_9DEIO|nr:hypothetical protein [Deinococcus aetherius]BDP41132.1 hypothetical protein DAETH_11010 [Deinococcus aetherius]